jgi:hypothetical protein
MFSFLIEVVVAVVGQQLNATTRILWRQTLDTQVQAVHLIIMSTAL